MEKTLTVLISLVLAQALFSFVILQDNILFMIILFFNSIPVFIMVSLEKQTPNKLSTDMLILSFITVLSYHFYNPTEQKLLQYLVVAILVSFGIVKKSLIPYSVSLYNSRIDRENKKRQNDFYNQHKTQTKKYSSHRIFTEEDRTVKSKQEAEELFAKAERAKKRRQEEAKKQSSYTNENTTKEKTHTSSKTNDRSYSRPYDKELSMLGIDAEFHTVSKQSLKTIYRAQAKLWHPDTSSTGLSEEALLNKMKDLNHAYEVLKKVIK